MRITEPGIYTMPAEDYHKDPAPTPSLSSGMIKFLIEDTPQHAWVASQRLNPNFEPEEKTIFDIGTAAHSLMLGDPRAFEIFSGPTWNQHKSAADQAKKLKARADGKIPLLAEQFERVQTMVASGKMQLATHQDAYNAFTDGVPEQSIFWEENGIWGRLRLDWLRDKRDVWDDYKTTQNANPQAWQRIAFTTGADIQAAWYRRGIRAVKLHRNPNLRFIVQEKSEPYALAVMEFVPEALELADRRIEQAIKKWRWCLANDSWPGYIGKTVGIAPPSWQENRQMEREVSEADFMRDRGMASSEELLALAMRFQAPL